MSALLVLFHCVLIHATNFGANQTNTRVNFSIVQVIITSDYCFLLKCKMSTGQEEYGERTPRQETDTVQINSCFCSDPEAAAVIIWS